MISPKDAKLRFENIAVIGAGAWGTTIADALASSNHKVMLWALEKDTAEDINKKRRNPSYLDNEHVLSENIKACNDISEASDNADLIISATPFRFMRDILGQISNLADKHLIIATKGLDTESGKLSYELISDYIDASKIALLSGASFASDVIRHRPVLITLASKGRGIFDGLQQIFLPSCISLEYSDDMVGVALAGALKNALAIASGIVIGAGYGESARSAVIIKGIKELQIFCRWRGADSDKLFCSAVLGDLIMTTTSMLSRNTQLGFYMGKGQSAKEIAKGKKTVFEGVNVALYLYRLASSNNLPMPLFIQLGQMLQQQQSERNSIAELMISAGLKIG